MPVVKKAAVASGLFIPTITRTSELVSSADGVARALFFEVPQLRLRTPVLSDVPSGDVQAFDADRECVRKVVVDAGVELLVRRDIYRVLEVAAVGVAQVLV